jgi:hypothetical protein
VGTRCADHTTPLYSGKFALSSPTSGGCSVGTACFETKAKEFVFYYFTTSDRLQNYASCALLRVPVHLQCRFQTFPALFTPVRLAVPADADVLIVSGSSTFALRLRREKEFVLNASGGVVLVGRRVRTFQQQAGIDSSSLYNNLPSTRLQSSHVVDEVGTA